MGVMFRGAAAGFAVLLGGCALAPGMYAGDVDEGVSVVARDPGTGKGLPVSVKRITPDSLGVAAERSGGVPDPGVFRGYTLGPGDVVSITIWEHPELTIPQGEFRSAEQSGSLIDEEGMLFYPYCGRFQAAGLTRADLRSKLTNCLARVLRKPQVDVRIIQYRSQRVQVGGAVVKPGIVPIFDIPLYLADALEQTGGLHPEAYARDIRLTRGNLSYKLDFKAYTESGNAQNNPRLLAGDVIHVGFANENRVNVMGEVFRPQSVFLNDSVQTLADVLAEVEGLNGRTAEAGRILVMRQASAIPEVHWLDASDALNLAAAQRFNLRDGDLVYVDQTGLNRWSNVLGQMLSFFSILNQSSAAATR